MGNPAAPKLGTRAFAMMVAVAAPMFHVKHQRLG
jgi:hypothetical protein